MCTDCGSTQHDGKERLTMNNHGHTYFENEYHQEECRRCHLLKSTIDNNGAGGSGGYQHEISTETVINKRLLTPEEVDNNIHKYLDRASKILEKGTSNGAGIGHVIAVAKMIQQEELK